MTKQTILVVDDKGNFTGEYVEKEVAHTGAGKHHKAISVIIFNSKGEILLQHRKHKVHNDIWDVTGSTHHLHKKNGQDETDEEATYRCLKREWGIKEKIPLKALGGVNYFAPYGDFCENEYDIFLIGKYNGPIFPSKDVSYNYKWMKKTDFLKDINKNPKNYAPWVVACIKLLKENTFFN